MAYIFTNNFFNRKKKKKVFHNKNTLNSFPRLKFMSKEKDLKKRAENSIFVFVNFLNMFLCGCGNDFCSVYLSHFFFKNLVVPMNSFCFFLRFNPL